MLAALTHIVLTFVSAWFPLVLTTFDIWICRKTATLRSRSEAIYFAFDLYSYLVCFQQYFLLLKFLQNNINVKIILSIKSVSTSNIFCWQENQKCLNQSVVGIQSLYIELNINIFAFQFLKMYLYFINALIGRLLVVYIVCQILSFDSLKLLLVLVNQKLLYFKRDSYICYILLVYIVQTELYLKSGFDVDLYVFRLNIYYRDGTGFACRSWENNKVCILNYIPKIFCYKIIL